MAKKKGLKVVETRQLSVLNTDEQALLNLILKAYSEQRLGSRNHQPKSVQSDIATVNDFITYIGKAPWYMDKSDFDKWCYHIGVERGVATNTQRKYQSAIQSLFTYIVENIKFRTQIQNQYGISVQQIVTTDNKIPHLTERQRTQEKPAFTHAQITQFFDAIERMIVESHKFRHKSFLPLQRDKAVFYAMYVMGLRNSECCNLNVHSFKPNAQLPEFGNFGFATVYGKGSNGSGAKIRTVPIEHPDLPPILDWYLTSIRPQFLIKPNADPNEEAFFLNERGARITDTALIARFKNILAFAGLDNLGFTPHCLRHSFTTHAFESGRSLEYTRRKLGHEYAATTQGYTHFSDEIVNKEIGQCAATLLDAALKKESLESEAEEKNNDEMES